MRGQDTVSVLKGVGEQREKRLHRLGIVTVEDLLTHYPREYKDRSEILKIADLPPDEPATFLAQIKEENIRAVADLTDYKESTGTYMPQVRVYVDGFTDVGAIGENTISIEIRKVS